MSEPGKGDRRGYSWPPFEAGHTKSLQSGIYSPRVLDPLAAQIVADQLASPSCPPHLSGEPRRWQYALAAWGRAEAQIQLILGYLDGLDVETALDETTTATETTETTKGRTVKRTAGRRRESALAALDRAERTAAARRNELGLTPASAARLRLDQTPPHPNLMQLAARLVLEDRAAEKGPRDDQPTA